MRARTQITMDPELQRRAHIKAADLGISFAEYVRRLVTNDLGAPKPKPHVSEIFDLDASDEPTDIARDKHKMIGEAVWNDYLRKTGRLPKNRCDKDKPLKHRRANGRRA